METSCNWFIEQLQANSPQNLNSIIEKHRSRDDSFDLNDVLQFLPESKYDSFTKSFHKTLQASLKQFENEQNQQTDITEKSYDPIKAAAEIASSFILDRHRLPVARFQSIIHDLHDTLLDLPAGHAQNQISKMCEWYWTKAQPERDRVVPQTVIYLLLRSFGDETHAVEGTDTPRRTRTGGKIADIKRVYAMRKALDVLDLSPASDAAEAVRNLLLRCPTSAPYLQSEDGKKFIAHLLTLEDMQEAVFDVLVNQLALVRKGTANLFGTVFLLAWKVQRSEWLVKKLTEITERAMFAAGEPFGTNLRTVLSTFHANKRANGVDILLHKVYGPVLFRNLMVANHTVRRNAVTILSDAFPIHDPGALMEDIESTLLFQSSKLVDLLEDPSPIVRTAAIQGSCRILGLLWEIVPPSAVKKMIDIITTKLAFDKSSSIVRLAVFEGLSFLLDNHMAHQHLTVTLPNLKCLINDTVHRVRLAMLDLLRKLKDKRLTTLRYFDVVPIDDLLLRLPREGPAGATKIMDLIVSSYFPVERKGKTPEELASSQIRAYLSMTKSSKEASDYFYKHINLHVAPGPLCEFIMRLSFMALDAPLPESTSGNVRRKKMKRKKGKSQRKTRRGVEHSGGKENVDPSSRDTSSIEDDKENPVEKENEIDRVTLLTTIADIIVSITPSLGKQANIVLRREVDNIFEGEVLKPWLIERSNPPAARIATWRIASGISGSKMHPIHVLWREQLDKVLDWPTSTKEECENYRKLLSALMLAGVKWKKVPAISAVVSEWSEAAKLGVRTSGTSSKAARRTKQKSKSSRNARNTSSYEEEVIETRGKALFALRACTSIIIEEKEFSNVFFGELYDASCLGDNLSSRAELPVVSAIRKGVIGALDATLDLTADTNLDLTLEMSNSLLQSLGIIWKLALLCSVSGTDNSCFNEIRELLQWLNNNDLWKNATKLSSSFAESMATISLSYCADAVSLGFMNDVDLGYIKKMTNDFRNNVNLNEIDELSRPIASLLRIVYQCREQKAYDEVVEGKSEKKCSLQTLTEVSNQILSDAFWLLQNGTTGDNLMTGQPRKPEAIENIIGSVLESFLGADCADNFWSAIQEPLIAAYANAESAERNLLASLTCNIVREYVTSRHPREQSLGKELVVKLSECMMSKTDDNDARKATVVFLEYVASSCFEGYNEDHTKPAEIAQEAFHEMRLILGKLVSTGNEDSEISEEVKNIQQTLTALANLNDRNSVPGEQPVAEVQNLSTENRADEENKNRDKSPDRKKARAASEEKMKDKH